MGRHLLRAVLALAVLGCGTVVAWGANSIEIESKTVNKGQTGVTISIKLTNDVIIRNIVLPIALRSITPGAFVTSLQPVFGDRLPTASGSPIAEIIITNQYADENGNCKTSQPGGFGLITFADGASHPVAAEPEGVLFVRGKILGATLPPGTDATGSMGLLVDVTTSQGQFEIDTTCSDPANHSVFVQDGTNAKIIPTLTKGTISIGHPPVARDTSWTTPEDSPKNVSYLPASDPDLDALTFSIITPPQHGVTNGFNPSTGAFSYVPDPNYHGPDSLEFRATDGGFLSNIAKVRITVISLNDPPVARDTVILTIEDTPVSGQLQAFDVDGDALTFSKLTGPFHGVFSAFNASTGTFLYTPAANYSGPDSITYRARDGVANSNTATVRITVAAVNDPPVARDTSVNLSMNATAALRFHSYDVDGGPPTYSNIAGPFNGTFSGFDPSTGVFTYQAGTGYTGRDSIMFQVNDGLDNSNVGTVRILISEIVCNCPFNGDPTMDGVTDVFDLLYEIDVIFESTPYPIIPPCKRSYVEMNCDCVLDVFDVIYLIDFLFSSGPPPCKLCDAVCP